MEMLDHDIGGARVRRTFTMGERRMKAADNLTGDEVRGIAIANRRALISAGYIELYPNPPVQQEQRTDLNTNDQRRDQEPRRDNNKRR